MKPTIKEQYEKVRSVYMEKHKEEAEPFKNVFLQHNSPSEVFMSFVHEFLNRSPHFFDSKIRIWWGWNKENSCWETRNETDILRDFTYLYGITDWIDPRIKNKIIESLRVAAFKQPIAVPHTWIQFKNKVVDFVLKDEFEATSRYFFTNTLPFDIADEDGSTPNIDKLFSEWLDERSVLLKEICAYCMYRAYPLPKIFLFFGTGRNGKSQYLKLLEKILGSSNMTTTSLSNLENGARFETIKLMNKLVCQLTELERKEEFPLPIFKKLTGGDLTSFEVKHGGFGEFRNCAKIIMATNTMPYIHEDSDAVADRFFVIDFKNLFKSTPVDIIDSIPEEEYPFLMRQCVNILDELLRTSKFSFEGTLEEKHALLKGKQNVLQRFFDENIEHSDGTLRISSIHEELKKYCKSFNVVCQDENGLKRYIRKYTDFVIKRTKVKENDVFVNVDVLDGAIFSQVSHISHDFTINSHIVNQYQNSEKVEKSEKSFEEIGDISCSAAPTCDIPNLKDTFSFADLQMDYELSPNEAEQWLKKNIDNGSIFECRPGHFKKLCSNPTVPSERNRD